MAEKILVLGGYGVFGGRLARRLVRAADAEILVAGRSAEKAEAHCRAYGGVPLAMDRDKDLEAVLAAVKPAIVIDAAGPFQAYGEDPYVWRAPRSPRAATISISPTMPASLPASRGWTRRPRRAASPSCRGRAASRRYPRPRSTS